jgi:phosphatidylglycerol:prolipoprotein diacylglycerol transferase
VLPVIHIFGLKIQTFGVMFALAFLTAGAVIARRLRELRYPPDWAYQMIVAALVGGLVGARGYYILQNVRHGLSSAVFSGSGLIWYGGVIGGAAAVGLWAWRRRFPALTLLDVCAPALALGYAVGRIGCQLSGDGDYGKVSHLPWAMGYPHGTVPTPPGVRVQPTPVYETLLMATVALVLWRLRDRYRPGVLFALYLVLAGLERFLIEFIRRNQHVLAGLTAAQLESLGMLAMGSLALAAVARRGGLLRSARPATSGG